MLILHINVNINLVNTYFIYISVMDHDSCICMMQLYTIYHKQSHGDQYHKICKYKFNDKNNHIEDLLNIETTSIA